MNEQTLTLSICLRCRDGRESDTSALEQRGGRRLSQAVATGFAAIETAARGVQLRGVTCMSQCKRPCVIALSGPDRFTYLFGDLDPDRDASAILSLAADFAHAEHGFLPRSERPAVLRAGILGRVPPLNFDGALVVPLCPSLDLETETLR